MAFYSPIDPEKLSESDTSVLKERPRIIQSEDGKHWSLSGAQIMQIRWVEEALLQALNVLLRLPFPALLSCQCELFATPTSYGYKRTHKTHSDALGTAHRSIAALGVIKAFIRFTLSERKFSLSDCFRHVLYYASPSVAKIARDVLSNDDPYVGCIFDALNLDPAYFQLLRTNNVPILVEWTKQLALKMDKVNPRVPQTWEPPTRDEWKAWLQPVQATTDAQLQQVNRTNEKKEAAPRSALNPTSFFAKREAKNKQLELTEGADARHSRSQRLKNAESSVPGGTTKWKFFEWRFEDGIWKRELLSRANGIITWEITPPEWRRYCPWSNEWDLAESGWEEEAARPCPPAVQMEDNDFIMDDSTSWQDYDPQARAKVKAQEKVKTGDDILTRRVEELSSNNPLLALSTEETMWLLLASQFGYVNPTSDEREAKRLKTDESTPDPLALKRLKDNFSLSSDMDLSAKEFRKLSRLTDAIEQWKTLEDTIYDLSRSPEKRALHATELGRRFYAGLPSAPLSWHKLTLNPQSILHEVVSRDASRNWYILQTGQKNLTWHLTLFSASGAVHALRIALDNPGITTHGLVEKLLRIGVRFSTRARYANPVPAPDFVPPPRICCLQSSLTDDRAIRRELFQNWWNDVESYLAGPRERAAALQGGVIWRLVMVARSGSLDEVVSDVFMGPKKPSGRTFDAPGLEGHMVDDELSEDEIHFLCGYIETFSYDPANPGKGTFFPPFSLNHHLIFV
jgi:hypothetical protein